MVEPAGPVKGEPAALGKKPHGLPSEEHLLPSRAPMTTQGNLLVASFLILGACATPANDRARDVREDQLREFQLIQQVFRTE